LARLLTTQKRSPQSRQRYGERSLGFAEASEGWIVERRTLKLLHAGHLLNIGSIIAVMPLR
jgi:hypothetical protein